MYASLCLSRFGVATKGISRNRGMKLQYVIKVSVKSLLLRCSETTENATAADNLRFEIIGATAPDRILQFMPSGTINAKTIS